MFGKTKAYAEIRAGVMQARREIQAGYLDSRQNAIRAYQSVLYSDDRISNAYRQTVFNHFQKVTRARRIRERREEQIRHRERLILNSGDMDDVQ